jgi:ribose transport system ATP-binding protein
VDLSLGAGEIVGLTGLPGSGFEAVPYLLAGAQKATGTLELGERRLNLSKASVSAIVREGVVLVPENRPRDGLGLDHTVMENISLPWLDARGSRWHIGTRWQEEEARHAIETLGIVPPNPRQLVAKLSGGNAQKVLLGKWLTGKPKLLLLHEPTQGVDVKARLDLLAAVHRSAGTGTTVLVASTEAEDLVTVCDRVIFFVNGRLQGELSYPFDVQTILDTVYSTTSKGSLVGSPPALQAVSITSPPSPEEPEESREVSQ